MLLPSLSRSSAIVPLLLLTLGGCDRQVSTNEQASAPASNATAPAPAGKVDRSHKGEAAPAISFTDPSGKAVTIASFKGRPVLLNLWATWCAPCVKEMPTLDAAAADRTIVAVSQDLDGGAKVAPFFAKAGFKHLQPYLDTKADLSTAYQANLPTSIQYDAAGHEVWRSSGGMDWTSPAAKALLAEAG